MNFNELSTEFLFTILIILLLLSALFSGAETAMMSINRYRLKSITKSGVRWASIATKLLQNPSRLLSVILIGNNFVNILTASIATVLGVRFFGGTGVIISTLILTVVILIFSEITPKTFAALYPIKLAAPASFVIYFLSKILAPFVFVLDKITTGLLRLFGVNTQSSNQDELTSNELRTVLMEGNKFIPQNHRGALIGLLDLNDKVATDVMVSKHKIVGINISWDAIQIKSAIQKSKYKYMAVYDGDIDDIIGVLCTRDIVFLEGNKKISADLIKSIMKKAYFIPENANLLKQFQNFSKEKSKIAFIVDEYSEIKGLITVDDIIDDIMKDFIPKNSKNIIGHKEQNGNILVDGNAILRDINKKFNLDLPTTGPKTISGLMIEDISIIPKNNVCIRMGIYQLDTVGIRNNAIAKVRIKLITK